MFDEDPVLGRQLAVAAYHLSPTPEARHALVTVESALSLGSPGNFEDQTSYVSVVAFSPDGKILATGSQDKTVRLWAMTDPGDVKPLATLRLGTLYGVNGVAFSPDGRTLAAGPGDGWTVRFWDVTDPRQPREVGTVKDPGGTRVAFTPDGKILAVSEAKTARLWDVSDPSNPRELASLPGAHQGDVVGVAFSRDGKTLATASRDNTARLWDVTNPGQPSPLATLTGHTAPLTGVAFSPDGKTVATTSVITVINTTITKPAQVRLWDVTDLRRPRQLATFEDHAHDVTGVAFALDATLATVSLDGTARLWDVADPTRPHPMATLSEARLDYLYAAAFAPDGNTLAVGSGWHSNRGGHVWLWDVNPDHLSEAICNGDGPLNPEAWAREVGVPYRQTCP